MSIQYVSACDGIENANAIKKRFPIRFSTQGSTDMNIITNVSLCSATFSSTVCRMLIKFIFLCLKHFFERGIKYCFLY